MDTSSAIVPKTNPTPAPMIVPVQSKLSSSGLEGAGLAMTTRVVEVVVAVTVGYCNSLGVVIVVVCVVDAACVTNNIGALMVCTDTEKVLELFDKIPFVTAAVRALVFVLANAP